MDRKKNNAFSLMAFEVNEGPVCVEIGFIEAETWWGHGSLSNYNQI